MRKSEQASVLSRPFKCCADCEVVAQSVQTASSCLLDALKRLDLLERTLLGLIEPIAQLSGLEKKVQALERVMIPLQPPPPPFPEPQNLNAMEIQSPVAKKKKRSRRHYRRPKFKIQRQPAEARASLPLVGHGRGSFYRLRARVTWREVPEVDLIGFKRDRHVSDDEFWDFAHSWKKAPVPLDIQQGDFTRPPDRMRFSWDLDAMS